MEVLSRTKLCKKSLATAVMLASHVEMEITAA